MSLISKQKYKKELTYLMFILPGILIYVIGMFLPIIKGVGYSLTDWDGLSETSKFIGISNYLDAFKDSRVLYSFWFTLKFTFWNTIIQNIFALAFAIALDSKIKGKKLLRTIIYIPALLSPILVGYIWNRLFTDVLPSLNSILHTNFNFSLLSNPDTVLSGLVIINNWQWIGYWMVVYLAALQSVPIELYEAIEIDGGGALKKFCYVTLPMIAPAITICIVSISTGSFKLFDLVVTATKRGGPGHASESMILLIYNMAFGVGRPSYASAISMIFLGCLMIFAVFQLKYFRKKEIQL